jgi:FemAB-related protein (PEP-CTERM system-associated)
VLGYLDAENMKLNIEAADECDARSWNEFVKMNPHATPYHLWEYGKSLSLTYGYKRFYLIAKEDEEIVGILPLIQVKSLLFYNKLISLPFCEYGGQLSESKYIAKSLWKMAIEVANKLKVDYVEIRNPSNIPDINGYHRIQRYVTFEIDLTKSKESLWCNLDKKTRNAIRKAMKNGVEVEEVKNENGLKLYYKLYLKTQKRHGSPPNSFKLFYNIYRQLQPMGIMRILLAKYQGKTIGGIITFHFNGIIYWWGGVMDPDYRHLNPTNLLLWEMIKWGIENDLKTFNLGRTRKNTSIYHFKSKWGGKEVVLQDYVFPLNSSRKYILPDPYQGRYKFLSKLWSILPIVLAEKIGPKIISKIGL